MIFWWFFFLLMTLAYNQKELALLCLLRDLLGTFILQSCPSPHRKVLFWLYVFISLSSGLGLIPWGCSLQMILDLHRYQSLGDLSILFSLVWLSRPHPNCSSIWTAFAPLSNSFRNSPMLWKWRTSETKQFFLFFRLQKVQWLKPIFK